MVRLVTCSRSILATAAFQTKLEHKVKPTENNATVPGYKSGKQSQDGNMRPDLTQNSGEIMHSCNCHAEYKPDDICEVLFRRYTFLEV